MGDSSTPLHHSICPTPNLDLISPSIIDKTIRSLMYRNMKSTQPERKIVCYEFDPQCFPPKISGIHGHLAYGKLGLAQLKRTLSMSRDQNEIGETLNTLCDLLQNPEMATSAMKLNILAQLRRLISHTHWYVRDRTVQAVKILVLQPSGRELIVNDGGLMENIICCVRDPSPCVRRTTYDLLLRLSTNYFVVAKLVDFGYIKIVIEELKQLIHKDDEVDGEGWDAEEITEVKGEEFGKGKELGGSTDTLSEKNDQESEGDELVEECEEEDYEATGDDACEILDEPDCVDKEVATIVTLLELLANLMTFSTDATLDAICYDVLTLRKFSYHEDRSVRLITWNIFKQIFSTDIGQMSLIPHNLLDDMMRPFDNEADEEEIIAVIGTLMLALVKVENRVEAWKKGILGKIVSLAKQPNLSSNKRLAVVNVLSHLVEIPEVRSSLIKQLHDTVLGVNLDSPTIEHHVYTHLERALWKP